jgi:hypothetical protein
MSRADFPASVANDRKSLDRDTTDDVDGSPGRFIGKHGKGRGAGKHRGNTGNIQHRYNPVSETFRSRMPRPLGAAREDPVDFRADPAIVHHHFLLSCGNVPDCNLGNRRFA